MRLGRDAATERDRERRPSAEQQAAFLVPPQAAPSWVGRQVLPPSIDRSTRATPQSPPKAMPRAEAGVPAGTLSPLPMLVMNDRGALQVTGTILNPVSPGFTVLCGVSGTR